MAPIYCRDKEIKHLNITRYGWIFWIDQEKSSLAVEIELCDNIFHIYKIFYLSYIYMLQVFILYQAAKG